MSVRPDPFSSLLPAAPPPEALAEVQRAWRRAQELADAGWEISFTPRTRRVSIALSRPGAAGGERLSPSGLLDLLAGPAGQWRIRVSPRRVAGTACDMDADRRLEQLEKESERLARHIEEARSDWEQKKADSGVPGAVEDVAGMDGDGSPQTDYPAKG